MRNYTFILVFLFLLLSQFGFGQGFQDDFSDGDFTTAPVWEGIPGDFLVNEEFQLQLNNLTPTGSDISFLTAGFSSESLDNKEWQFYIKHSFSGSANNNGRFWLAVDETNPSSVSATGYYLQFGEAGSNDAIELFYSNSGIAVSVCRGADGSVASSFEFRIRVRRDAGANWSIDVDQSGGTDFVNDANGNHALITSTDRLGVICTYTSSNSTKFYYDDIYFGEYIFDTIAPQLLSVSVTTATTLQLQFDESMDGTTAAILGNYSVDPATGNLTTATVNGGDNSIIDLTFDTPFAIGTNYNLTVNAVTDLAGNAMVATTLPFVYFLTEEATEREVSINEIFADPTPPVLLPDAEFIELYNRSSKFINLMDWTISDGSSTSTLDSVVLFPGGHLIITSTANAPAFVFLGDVMGVGSFPSLNNAGDLLELRDSTGALMDVVNYTNEWYLDEDKADGGYTLEQVNPFANCSGAANWLASNATQGGTPGTANSVYDDTPDSTPPVLLDIQVITADTVIIQFDEPLLDGSITIADISVSDGVVVSGFGLVQPDLTSMTIWFDAFVDSGVVYTLSISDLTDCEGNVTTSSNGNFILPFSAELSDLAINEILFNPRTGGDDYIEIKNRSTRTVDLMNWSLADFDEDSIGTARPISLTHFPLDPGGIVAITEDSTNIKMEYITHGIGHFIETDIPSMGNDSGTVYLLSPNLEVAERFFYTEDMHFALLDPDGVSLERIDVGRPVSDATNWHSAAQTIGFGTPGLENSQYYLTNQSEGEVTTDPEIFSPDYDGFNDVLNINYRFTEIGNVATITIYDTRGRVVRQLAENILLNAEGTISWDGEQEDGSKARIGMYLIVFEVFNADGNTNSYKVSTVLGGGL